MRNEDAIREAIEGAEEVTDLLNGLVDRARQHPGAPFVPEVLDRLRQLKQEDRSAFEDLRYRLKNDTDVRVSELDRAVAKGCGDEPGEGATQTEVMLRITADADLFHTSDDVAYADIIVNGHRETWPVTSRGFRRWLTQRFYLETRSAPSSEALQSALSVVQAQAHFEGPERKVWVRVGGADGKVYLDLVNESWQAIEIDGSGWRIVSEPSVRFRRSSGMKSLPTPEPGGSIDLLRPFVNVSKESDFVLIIAWLLAALRDRGPYPVMALSGEQGTAKSTLSNIIRALVDPNSVPLRAMADGDRDLFIAATNAHVLSFDNISGLRTWVSDTLCRLATGGGFATRQLWTDQDEVLFTATRPIVLNGIEDIVSRPDLGDRAIILTLEPIPAEKRKPEKVLWAELEAVLPKILGALLDGVVRGLRNLSSTPNAVLPRMADFAHWIAACEGAFWPAGTFAKAYQVNQSDAVRNILEADPVASAIQALMQTPQTTWTGNATELLAELAERTSDAVKKSPAWPKTAQVLAGRVRRAATFLRASGIDIVFNREGRERKRTVTISLFEPEKPGLSASAASASSAVHAKPLDSNDAGQSIVRTVPGLADAGDPSANHPSVRGNSFIRNGADAADAADAKTASESTGWSTRI